MFIKNRTPYLGKITLKFEKDPHYTGKTKLNKIHLNLGFTKLVSRIHHSGLDGFKADPKKIELIEKYTGGVIGTHTFGPNNEFTLYPSFLSPTGEYLGDIQEGWFYYRNNLIVTQKNPRGVALKMKPDLFKMSRNKSFLQDDYMNKFAYGYYGYSHRGGAVFKIGDRIFEPGYEPVREDYPAYEWKTYEKKLEKLKIEYEKNDWMDESDLKFSSIVPFHRRGNKLITSWEEAEQAAENLSNYLS